MAKPDRPTMSQGLTGAVNKGAPAPAELTAPPAPDVDEDGPGLTLYLKRHSYEALKQLGISERKPVHALLVEAVSLLFESRNLTASALPGNRPGSKHRVTKGS